MSSQPYKPAMQDAPPLKEVCSSCGKVVSQNRKGSITSWIFQEERCCCQKDPAQNGLAILSIAHPDITEPSDTAKPSLSVPSFGDRYEVLSIIGQGGMGAVYKVKDLTLNKIFAAKVIRNELVTDELTVKRFQREVEACSLLTHSNLAATFGHGVTSQGSPYLLMEFVEGETLHAVIEGEGFLDTSRVLDIFIQTGEALAYAHARDIVHRDLKPSNILLSKTAEGHAHVKLVDFGIAKVQSRKERQTYNLTGAAEVFGSPDYMSPEQCLGLHVDSRSDIYSLGCVIYEALTGKPPFPAKNVMQVLAKHLNEPPESLSNRLSTHNKSLQTVILTCLQKDPNNRYQNATDLVDDLRAIQEGKDIRSKVLTLSTKPRRPRMELLPEFVPYSLIVVSCWSPILLVDQLAPWLKQFVSPLYGTSVEQIGIQICFYSFYLCAAFGLLASFYYWARYFQLRLLSRKQSIKALQSHVYRTMAFSLTFLFVFGISAIFSLDKLHQFLSTAYLVSIFNCILFLTITFPGIACAKGILQDRVNVE
jgi:serine/threonine protein kinase